MKFSTGLATVAFLFVSPAFAQTAPAAPAPAPAPTLPAACTGLEAPSPPTLPDGATATNTQMARGDAAYQAWGNERLAKLQACRPEIVALRAQLNAMEAAFLASNTELRTVGDSWTAEVTEFNNRTSSRRQRGSIGQ